MKIKYYKELDGVRGIAALMIILFHFFQGTIDNIPSLAHVKKFITFGQTGVSLFFVLSGFLITRILLSTKERPKYFTNFYLRRAVRIFPLYYGYLLLFYFVVNPLINHIPDLNFGTQVYFWFYLENFALTFGWKANGPFHFWSLAVEEHFYLFWPLVIYYLDQKKIVIAAICIVVIAFVTRIILEREHYEVFYFTFSRMDELAIGSILAVFEREDKLIGKSRVFIYLFIAILIPTAVLWVAFAAKANPMIQIVKFLLISFSYFSFIGYVITAGANSFINKILTIKPLLYTGKVSYGLYVFHPICFVVFALIFKNQPIYINFLGGLLLTYIIAYASFYFFESRFLRLKKYFE